MQPRATVLTILLLLGAAVGMRVEAQAVPGTLHSCVSVTSDKERLRCFDREMAKLEAPATRDTAAAKDATPVPSVSKANSNTNTNTQALAGNATPEAGPKASPAAPLAPEQAFGLSGDQILKLESKQAGTPRPTKLKNLTAQIASVSQNSAGRWVITLDNGQVWRQSETREFKASAGVAVKISSGAMGSFWLETDSHNWTRVERVL